MPQTYVYIADGGTHVITVLRRKDLELRVSAADPKLCIFEERFLGELPDDVPHLDMADLDRILD